MNFQILDPWYLVLLFLFPILHLSATRFQKAQDVMSVSDISLFSFEATGKIRWRKVPFLLYHLALICFVFALSKPVFTYEKIKIVGEGIDIALVMDLSGSMLADDFVPNRLEVAKEVAIDFVRRRNTDRIGLICFAGEAYTNVPLTIDKSLVSRALSELQIGELKDGTAIGMGIATAINRLNKSDAKSKIIILMTDGDNNAGAIQPELAASMARQFDIKIYTIGIGSDTYANLPVRIGPEGDIFYQRVMVKLDEEVLKAIADETSGQYFRATDKNSLEEIYSIIDRLERVEIEQNTLKKHNDIYHFFLISGLMLFTLAIALHATIFKTRLI